MEIRDWVLFAGVVLDASSFSLCGLFFLCGGWVLGEDVNKMRFARLFFSFFLGILSYKLYVSLAL